jgi:hypothetical protein
MNPGCIPIRLSLAEVCAAALMDAADTIEAARNAGAFVEALDGNHRLWLVLRDIEPRDDWTAPPTQAAKFATAQSSGSGRGGSDAAVDSVVAINRMVASELTIGGDMARICSRVGLAYRESGGGDRLAAWALAQIHKKSQLRSVFGPASPSRGGLSAIRTAVAKIADETQWPVTAD